MTTVMQWGNSDGVQGRCDARCHNARGPNCDCMCGGRFHGKGLQPGALEKEIREFGKEILASARKRAAAEGLEIKESALDQLLLF